MESKSLNILENQEDVCSICHGAGYRVIPIGPDDEIEQKCECQEVCGYDLVDDETN